MNMKRNEIICQLYFGRGQYGSVPQSAESKRMEDEFFAADMEFKEALKKYPELLDMYQDVIQIKEGMFYEGVQRHYFEGFRFGVLLGIDIASEETSNKK